MTGWRIRWYDTAQRALLKMPWRDAARVDAAVLAFAATGGGRLVRLEADASSTRRLDVKPYGIRLEIERANRTIHVAAVYRLR